MDNAVQTEVAGTVHDGTVHDIARRASRFAEELAEMLGRLADAAAEDIRVREARYRLQDAADSCRRAGAELAARGADPAVRRR